jgi:tetratricopeptide (TPR) repeat protein
MKRSFIATALIVVAALAASCSEDPQKAKLKFLASGDKFVAQKNYPDAIIQYRNAVSKDGSFGEARFKLGAAYEATGDVRNALREFVRAADLMPNNVEAQVRAGQLLGATGQFPEAKERAVAALEKDPKNVKALLIMANALAGMKDIDGAITQVEEAIDTNPRFDFAYGNLGILRIKKGEQSAAEDAFKRAAAIAPKSAAVHLNLGNFYWASGERAKAEQEFKAAISIEPTSALVNRTLTAFYTLGGQRAAAEPYIKTYAAQAPGPLPKLALADYYLTDNRTKEAAAVLEPLTKDPGKDPDGFVRAKLRLSQIDFVENRRPQAYQQLEDVLKRFPKNDSALEEKARLLIADQKYDEAISITNTVIAGNPKAARSHFMRGVSYQAKGNIDDAIKSFLRVLEIAPSVLPAQVQLANLYLVKRDVKGALDFLSKALKEQPRSSALHLLMGQARLQSGDLKNAEVELVAVARVNPTNLDAQTWLARLYLAKEDHGRARQAFSRALELSPTSVLALNGLVTLDVIEKKADAARAKLEPRLTASPDDVALTYLAANSYLTLGDSKRAEELFKKVLQLDPANIAAYGRLAGILLTQNRLDEGKAELEQAIVNKANPVMARTLLGMIFEIQGKPAEARAQYEQALVLNPRAPVAANNLAWQYAENGNLDLALGLSQTAKAELPNDARVSDTLGYIYYKKGLASLAVTALRQSVDQNPSNPTTHYHLGLAYLKDGKQTDAQHSLQRALKLDPKFAQAQDAQRVLATIKG